MCRRPLQIDMYSSLLHKHVIISIAINHMNGVVMTPLSELVLLSLVSLHYNIAVRERFLIMCERVAGQENL